MSGEITLDVSASPDISLEIVNSGEIALTLHTGIPGPAGPAAISSDPGQQATLGTDSLVYVGGLAAASHTHAISDVTGLAGALAGKADASHTQAWSTITSTPTTLAGYGITDAAAASHTHTASQISDSTAAGRAILTAADAAAQRTALGLGSAALSATGDFQPANGRLTAFAAATGILSDHIYYYSGSGFLATEITAAARSLLDDSSTATMRTTLGLGTSDTPQFSGLTLGGTIGANVSWDLRNRGRVRSGVNGSAGFWLNQASSDVAFFGYNVSNLVGLYSSSVGWFLQGDLSNGRLAINLGSTVPTAGIDINHDTIRLRTSRTPSSASASGNAGDICWDSSYLYVCTATNTWKRAALSSW